MAEQRLSYYTPDQILERKYQTLAIPGWWGDLIGTPEKGFWVLVYAMPKQGKSYLVTQLADELTRVVGNGVYWSCEEGVGYSVKRRLETLGISGHKLKFLATSNKEDIERILSNKTNRFAVIDSPEHLGLTGEEAKEIFSRWHHRKTVIIVQHVNGKGEPKGGSVWEHLVDTIIHIKRPYIYQRGRYGGAPQVIHPLDADKIKFLPNLFNTP